VLDNISLVLFTAMKKFALVLVVLCIVKINSDPGDFRPPAVPLIVFSPHISGNLYKKSYCNS